MNPENIYSQCGEDGIIEGIFDKIGTKNRWCVEFGAGDGKTYSNTLNLISKGWKAVLIEADDISYDKCLLLHRDNPNISVIKSMVGWLPENSLDKILSKTECPVDFDLCSIDVDGNDWTIWDAVTKYKPRVVIVEINHTFPPYASYVQDDDPEVNVGNSLLAFVQLGKIKGYELAAATDLNAIFVVKEEFSKLGIEDNSPEKIWKQRNALTWIAIGYDGRLIVGGNNKNLWGNEYIDFNKINDLIKIRDQKDYGYGSKFKSGRIG